MNGSAALPPPATVLDRTGRVPTNARTITRVVLALILLAALAVRLYGLNWDDGRDLHPDELYVAKDVLINRIEVSWPPDLANLLDPDHSKLNPRSINPDTGLAREYPYGALPLLVTDVVAGALTAVTGTPWTAADHAYLLGRALSALLDSLTALMVFATARRLVPGTIAIALAAALFAACAPLAIQLAHFFTTDSWLTFFVSVTLYVAIRAAESGSGRWYAAAGAGLGLALATKGSVFALAGVIAAAMLYGLTTTSWGHRSLAAALRSLSVQIGSAGLAALVAFAMFEPYALVRPGIYVQSLRTQAEIVSGRFDIPFTRVFVGTEPVIYQLEQLLKWGFGPIAGVLAVIGFGLLARDFWTQPTAAAWILLCWLAGYSFVILLAETKFLRYLAPLVPVLAICAALALGRIHSLVSRRWNSNWAVATVSILMLGSIAWTVAFVSIYAAEHPRLTASRWMYANIPAGSRLSWEYWDDRLPKPLGPGLTEGEFQYQFETIDLYRDQPPEELVDALFDTTRQLDYIVTSSNRISAAIPRSPWRYAVQRTFLDELANGSIGFTPVATFQVAPRLGPWVFDDRNADESFINYDHPRVTIYQRTSKVTRDEFHERFAWAINQPWQPARYATSPTLRLDQPVGHLPVLNDFQWSAGLTSNSLAAAIVWVAVLAVLQWVGGRLAQALLPHFADAGAGLGMSILWITMGYVVWLGASLAVVPFHALTVALILIALTVLSAVIPRWLPATVAAQQRRLGQGALVVFWGVFTFFLVLRVLNPDSWHPIWGGEKPMEFAHLNATLRSANFPPYDPWFADGTLNYYYYGLYLVAVLIKLTGIPTAIAYNLAQPTVIALLATTGFSVGATLGRAVTRCNRGAWLAGGLSALLLVGIGNLSALARLLSNQPQDFGSFIDWVWDGSRAIRAGITEFPFFTALYADLHAHVVALPITVTAIALAYSVAATGPHVFTRTTDLEQRINRRRFALLLALLALTIGTLFPTNAWDLPAYAALSVTAIIMSVWSVADWRYRLAIITGLSAGVLGLAYVLFRPFHTNYVAPFSALERVREATPLTEAGTHVGTLAIITMLGLTGVLVPWRRSLPVPLRFPAATLSILAAALLVANFVARADSDQPIVPHALFLLLTGALMALVIWSVIHPDTNEVGAVALPWLVVGVPACFVLLAAIGTLVSGQLVLGGYLIMASLAWVGWLRGRTLGVRFVALMILAASGVGAGIEVFFVADDLVNTTAYRMNTIFKFSNQIWVMLSLSAGVLLSAMVIRSGWFNDASRQGGAPSPERQWSRATVLISGILISASLLYPIFAIGPRLAQRFPVPPSGPTLNGLAWMESGTLPWLSDTGGAQLQFADDLAAISWLNANVPGSPVIAEASIGPYRCNGSRFSIATGLPTIIGWERHEQQQRPPAELSPRVQDVLTLYESSDRAAKRLILDKYKVDYVALGPLERFGISPGQRGCEGHDRADGIAVLEGMVGTDLEIAFRQGETTIYRVLRPTTGTGS